MLTVSSVMAAHSVQQYLGCALIFLSLSLDWKPKQFRYSPCVIVHLNFSYNNNNTGDSDHFTKIKSNHLPQHINHLTFQNVLATPKIEQPKVVILMHAPPNSTESA